jgi:hypothetical protein
MSPQLVSVQLDGEWRLADVRFVASNNWCGTAPEIRVYPNGEWRALSTYSDDVVHQALDGYGK